jgi:UDP-N-acetylmuramyl pentapeptide phosphotransferase/UDP-N-acetylglucosamine-1-phosphate transferase
VLGGALGALAALVVAVLWQQAVLILMLVCLLCAGAIGFEFRRVPAEQRRLQAMGQARQREVAQLLSAAVEQRGKLLVRWDWYASRLTALTGWMPQRTRKQQ